GRCGNIASRGREDLYRSVRVQSTFCRSVRSPHLRMEKQRYLHGACSRSVHMETLSRENSSHVAGDMGSLDSADGDHIFFAFGAPVPAVRPRAFVLAPTLHFHDQSV